MENGDSSSPGGSNKGWMPELANGPGSNPGAVKRMQDRDLLHPPQWRDDGIGKRTRLESEGGKNSYRIETCSLRHGII